MLTMIKEMKEKLESRRTINFERDKQNLLEKYNKI